MRNGNYLPVSRLNLINPGGFSQRLSECTSPASVHIGTIKERTFILLQRGIFLSTLQLRRTGVSSEESFGYPHVNKIECLIQGLALTRRGEVYLEWEECGISPRCLPGE